MCPSVWRGKNRETTTPCYEWCLIIFEPSFHAHELGLNRIDSHMGVYGSRFWGQVFLIFRLLPCTGDEVQNEKSAERNLLPKWRQEDKLKRKAWMIRQIPWVMVCVTVNNKKGTSWLWQGKARSLCKCGRREGRRKEWRKKCEATDGCKYAWDGEP